jgi:hypothetical protein
MDLRKISPVANRPEIDHEGFHDQVLFLWGENAVEQVMLIYAISCSSLHLRPSASG